jgi:hypothetical protein
MITRLVPGIEESVLFAHENLRFEVPGNHHDEKNLSKLIQLHVEPARGHFVRFVRVDDEDANNQSSLIETYEYSWIPVKKDVGVQTIDRRRKRRRRKKHSRGAKKSNEPIRSGVSIFKYLAIRESVLNQNSSSE